MQDPRASESDSRERFWRALFFCSSAAMAGFALVDLDSGRPAAAAGGAGVSCLMLSLMNQFPVVRAILAVASKRISPAQLQRESERLREEQPWTERLAGIGWSLLLASLILRALGVD